jgi:hypothetical protein
MKRNEIQNIIKSLKTDKIHILYFTNKVSLVSFFKNPLLLVLKIHNFFAKENVDHTAHISRFITDEDGNKYAKIFEATTKLGMQQNDLLDRLEEFKGILIIETLGNVDKTKAKVFENKYYGKPYSKLGAGLAGLDGWFNKFKPNNNALFCSYLTALFLKNQGYKISNEQELTPNDLLKIQKENSYKKQFNFI